MPTPPFRLACRRLPVAVRFMLMHGVVGFGLSALLMAAVLAADPGGIGTLLRRAEGHPWPLLLLWFFVGLTFGSVQIGTAVMGLAQAPPPPRPAWPPPLPPAGERDGDEGGATRS